MKNVTFSLDEGLIEQARAEAQARGTTLHVLLQEWLNTFARRDIACHRVEAVFKEMNRFNSGGRFSRSEMNER